MCHVLMANSMVLSEGLKVIPEHVALSHSMTKDSNAICAEVFGCINFLKLLREKNFSARSLLDTAKPDMEFCNKIY